MKAFYTILFTCMVLGLAAQDPQFSQYNASPMTLNPALTGFFTGDVRVAANFRSQWGSFVNPFRTAAFSVESSFFKGKWKGDYFALGLSFLSDRAGTVKLTTNQIGLSLAFKKNLGRTVKHSLAIGVQSFFLQQSISTEMLIFDNQYNGIEADPTIPSGEVVGSNGKGGVDLGAGFLYQIIPNRYYNIYIGGAYYHILAPKISLFDNSTYILKPKYVSHIGAKIDVNKAFNLLPSIAYIRQAGSQQINVGTYFQFVLEDGFDFETSFSIGAWARLTDPAPDAIIFGARIDYMNFVLGLSYDLNISALKTATQTRGAYELSLIYTGKIITAGQRKMTIPCPQL